MARGYSKRTKNVYYESKPAGMRALGVSKVASKAAGLGASRLVSAANALDPKGKYAARGVGLYAGWENEPRNGAVVEGQWYPGGTTAALLSAMRQVYQK